MLEISSLRVVPLSFSIDSRRLELNWIKLDVNFEKV